MTIFGKGWDIFSRFSLEASLRHDLISCSFRELRLPTPNLCISFSLLSISETAQERERIASSSPSDKGWQR